tara:strand:- start:1051 stop:1341 length:291 start_codon:yes stop_codon:yes gene_type:complete
MTNALSNHYGKKDSRYQAAKLMDAIVPFIIEELSDCRGGKLTIMPLNDMDDMTAIYQSESGSVMIAQLSIDGDDPKTIDFLSDDLRAVIDSIKAKP